MRSWHCALSLAAVGAVLCPPGHGAVSVEPEGEWGARIALLYERILHGEVPRFTERFILADVVLDPGYPRRFSEYSGDLSGRVIGALACMPREDTWPFVDTLVTDAIACQQADGRFGNKSLVYTPDQIGMEHMALLWGNGRLLTGLLEYNAARPNPTVVAAARRLGDFLLTVRDACAQEQVRAHVADLSAAGIICFTQLVEPLVMLYQETNDARYLEGARSIIPCLPEARGKQHSHGYLTTLRGGLMVYEASHDAEVLAWVERLYDSLVHSDDYEVYGGVRELFARANDNDEGCSEADFLRLSVQLARITGKAEYWDYAERCLLNQFFGNQFSTGDFGHHAYDSHGVKPIAGVGRAWWCCTTHALRAFRDVADTVAEIGDGCCRVNLWVDARWRNGEYGLQLVSRTTEKGRFTYTARVTGTPEGGVLLAFRHPAGCGDIHVTVDGSEVPVKEEHGYAVLPAPLKEGAVVELACELAPRFLTRDGQWLTPEALTGRRIEAALFVGPWLLGVDGDASPDYFGEPWTGNQVVWRPMETEKAAGHAFEVPCAHVTVPYVHDGFPGEQPVTLRPLSEQTAHGVAPFAVWLSYGR